MTDTTLVLAYPTGSTIDTQIEAPDNTVWNGTAYIPLSVASWVSYATETPETPASSGIYVCQFPIGSPPGNYKWRMYLRAGASPASTDVCVGMGTGYWNGTTFGAAALDHTQPVPSSNTAGTVGDSLNAARAQGFGKWEIQGLQLILYGPDNVTPVKTFQLDSPSFPTVRA
jgi:hypothetical protein